MAHDPVRVARVVLTPPDSLEYFFSALFTYLPWRGRIPGGLRLMSSRLV